MPLMKLCRCGKEIEYSKKYCTLCTKQVEKEKRDRVKRYDREVRYSKENIRYARFYNSPEWKRLSEYIKRKFNGLCVKCLIDKGEINNCDTTHHIEELKARWDMRLQEDNLICLCESCHQNIHANYTDAKKEELRNLLQIHKQRYE